MDTTGIVALLVLVVLLSAATYTELTHARIPNWLTLGGLACGLTCGLLPGGLPLAHSFLGLVFGFGTLFIFYVFGGMGGGDVKLMGAVGALIGHQLVLSALLYTAIIGGVMAMCLLAGRAAGNLWRWARASLAPAHAPAPAPATPVAKLTIPYAIAIAIGTLLVFVIGPR